MLPAVLDPWAAHALYEAANLAATTTGSKIWLVSVVQSKAPASDDDDWRRE